LPKLTATPVFVPVSSAKAWNCQFKTTTDGATVNFGTTGCSFMEENITHVTCGCNHLTEFTGQLVLDNVAVIPSSIEMLQETTDLIAAQLVYEAQKRIYVVETPTTPTVIVAESPVIIRDFYWSHNGFYLGLIVFAFFIFAILLNMGKVKKNALKKFLEQGQSILVLTYHPILSIFIRAHTVESNTQLMRINKFFCQLQSYIGLTGLVYLLLDLIISLSETEKLIATTAITLVVAPLTSYVPEFAYQRHKKKKNEGQRMHRAYYKIQVFMMLVWFLIGLASIGFIRAGFRGSWLGSLILTAALDLFVIDFLILIFAMVKRNNSKFLKCFQRKGYYVDVGSAAVMKNDDEIVLMAKIRKVLKKSKKKDQNDLHPNDTSRALTFGDKSHLDENKGYKIEEMEDLNESVEVDANNHLSPEMEIQEDEVALNSKNQIEDQDQEQNINIEEDKKQVAETRGNRDAEKPSNVRRGTKKRTAKAGDNEEDDLFEVNSQLDLSELVNQIDKHARPKPRGDPFPLNANIKKPSVPVYDMSKKRSSRTRNKY